MEFFDILDEEGNFTGEVRPRPHVHSTRLWHRTVHVWVMNERRELLIQKRNTKKLSYPGLWDISVAGHVTSGDRSLPSAIRETQEEIGLSISEEDLEYLFTVKQKDITNKGTYIDYEITDVYLLTKNVTEAELSFNDGEVTGVQFVPFEQLEQQIKDTIIEIVPHQEEYELLFSYLHKRYDMKD